MLPFTSFLCRHAFGRKKLSDGFRLVSEDALGCGEHWELGERHGRQVPGDQGASLAPR